MKPDYSTRYDQKLINPDSKEVRYSGKGGYTIWYKHRWFTEIGTITAVADPDDYPDGNCGWLYRFFLNNIRVKFIDIQHLIIEK